MTSPTSDRRFGVIGSLPIKAPVKAATTGNITLNAEQSIDGVSCVTGDRVLVKDQTTASENGIWVVDSGDWSRSVDANGNYDLTQGTFVYVINGTTNSNTYWRITTTAPITIGSSSISFSDAITNDSATLSFLQAGTGAEARSVQSKLRETVSVTDFGALIDGSTNDSAAIQSSVDAASVVVIPSGTCMMSSQVTIDAPCHLIIEATISPKVNASSSGTPLFMITSSDVIVEFRNGGGIDCISSSYAKWCGIAAQGSSGMIENVHVRGGKFRNVGIDDTLASVVNFSGVRGGSITRTHVKDCGVVGNVAGGGWALYAEYCEGLEISGNWGDTVGSTWINNSAGLDCIVRDNHCRTATLFGYKGGYGTGVTVTNDEAPTSTMFTVTKSAATLRKLKVGQFIMIPRNASSCPYGMIETIEDNTTYLKITLSETSTAASNGEGVQPLDTGCVWENNDCVYSGDNGFDQNGVSNIVVKGNRLAYCGWYQDAGVFGGLGAGIWIGYDNQGALNSMFNEQVTVLGNQVRHTYGSAIQIFVSNNVKVSDNRCHNYDEGQDPADVTPDYGGIDVGRLGFYRNAVTVITDNVCTSSDGYGIFAGFSDQMTIARNTIRGLVGIKVNTPRDADVSGNHIYVSGNAGYGLLVSDDSGTNPGSGINISRNYIGHVGTTGWNIRVSDASLTGLTIADDNYLSATNDAVVRIGNAATANWGVIPISGAKGGQVGMSFAFSLAAGQTIKLGRYEGDTGAFDGGILVRGFARSGTAAGEYFEVAYWGDTASPTVVFSSKSNIGGAFLAAGDFTMVINTPSTGEIECKYTNNEANTVFMSLSILSMSRF